MDYGSIRDSPFSFLYTLFGAQTINLFCQCHNVVFSFSVCKSMKSWLDSDPQHVVVVHCKGGKGRTGCVIASFMNYSQICQT